jgi:tRNA (cytidine/uridine-2'-O-)-methyltransferase
MPLNIVLIEPEIPTNTGNIGRLSLATGSNLHLVKPYGFEISDSRLKRAGLDYWKHINLFEYDGVDEFFAEHSDKELAFYSSHGSRSYLELEYSENQFLVFGKESVGLSNSITERNSEKLFQIPLYSEHIRSLNLANSVAVALYEGLRQLG